MKKDKSKILKLKKKYNRTLWLEKNLFKIIVVTMFPSIAAMCLSAILQILPLFIVGVSFFIASFGALSCDVGIHNLIFNRRAKIDDEIEKLLSSDEQEKQIFNEYVKLEEIKENSKENINIKNNLIVELIKNKNREAKKYNKLVKDLTKKKKSQVEQEVIADIVKEQTKNTNIVTDNKNQGYSRTKATKVYAEKVNEVVKEENEKGLN